MKALIILVTCIITMHSSFSYPISPRPLRKLIIESEYIITGNVLTTGTITTNNNKNVWESDYALVLVERLLQGKPVPDTVKVYYSAAMICPAPPVYHPGEAVIVFLDKNPGEQGTYFTHALSYGAKSFTTKSDRDVYQARILEMQEILAAQNPSKKHDATIEWLVQCAAHPATRWDGVYELSPQSDFMSYYDDDKAMKKSVFLNTAQKEFLFNSFIKIDKPTHNDLYIVDMITGVNDVSLLEQLKSRLTTAERDDRWLSSLIMHYIVQLTGNKELESIHRKFDGSIYNQEKKGEKQLQQTYDEFLRKMEAVPIRQTHTAYGRNAI
ncbi:MAG: hypothetical protein KF862_20275 [Chitinophagaceae bacterium]|nr:hypothetical protein [Chitinophagaceae bacterium]